VYASDAGYLDTRGLLYRAYYFQGLDFKQAQDWQNALTAFQTALAIDDSGDEARAELSATQTTIQNLRPGALGEKWIEVNLTTQRFRALQGQTVVYAFVTSTGENGRETQPGRYQVLDKIPNAYSRFWNLWMPYWMGIYWAGSSENGIHALPILSSGQTLWAGYLGSRVSFGCVILDTSAAKLIYDWADIGTTVVVHY
jgi:lipoprotein-anchoring transpeptidase ErfK/SrfK